MKICATCRAEFVQTGRGRPSDYCVAHRESQQVLGLAPWSPNAATAELRAAIDQVLNDYQAQWPLTLRQIGYILIGQHGFTKSDDLFSKVGHNLGRARRAGVVPWRAIRDDSTEVAINTRTRSPADHARAHLRSVTAGYHIHRQQGQAELLVVWCEAAGMVPQLERAVGGYDVDVISSGGFDSLTTKHALAERIAEEVRPVRVFHIGDFDPSGRAIFDNLRDDVTQMVFDLADKFGWCFTAPTFMELALTAEHAAALPASQTEAPKPTKNGVSRFGNWPDDLRTAQAEALPPDVLADLVQAAVMESMDAQTLIAVTEREADLQEWLRMWVADLPPVPDPPD